jgi:6,7-dimethyl-8-ribityllumazine synthase
MPQASGTAILVAEFNKSVTGAMLKAALSTLEAATSKVVKVIKVPGAYELPLAAKLLLSRRNVQGLVVLGFIERGETLHGEVMGHVVHQALVRLQLKTLKPMGLGIIGPGATEKQAHKRKIDYGRAAAQAALRMLAVLQELK